MKAAVVLEAGRSPVFADADEPRDVVLDDLWGRARKTLLAAAARAAPDEVPIRFVQIGSVGGADVTLPGAVRRSSSLVPMGSGIGSLGFARMHSASGAVFTAAGPAGLQV